MSRPELNQDTLRLINYYQDQIDDCSSVQVVIFYGPKIADQITSTVKVLLVKDSPIWDFCRAYAKAEPNGFTKFKFFGTISNDLVKTRHTTRKVYEFYCQRYELDTQAKINSFFTEFNL